MDYVSKENENLHVITVDMENRPVEDIARDAAMQIAALFDRLVEEQKIEEHLREQNVPNVAIQGEFCGAGIQKNRLKLAKPEWYVFTIIDMGTGRRYPLSAMQKLCEKLSLKMVPVEEQGEAFPYDSIEELLDRAKGKYRSGMNKEGIVIRPTTPVYSRTIEGPLSAKVLNNDYLLKD